MCGRSLYNVSFLLLVPRRSQRCLCAVTIWERAGIQGAVKNVQCRTVPEKQEETFVKYLFVLLLTTAVNAVSSVKKGLVKIDGLTFAIFVSWLWITHLSADYKLREIMNCICTFHALHFSGLWTLIIITCHASNKCRGPRLISLLTTYWHLTLWNTFIYFQRDFISKAKTASYHFHSVTLQLSFQLSLFWRTF